jgi:hypothetical protein
MDARNQVYTCPACGRQTAYQPEEYELLVRLKPGDGMKEVRYRPRPLPRLRPGA